MEMSTDPGFDDWYRATLTQARAKLLVGLEEDAQ